MLHLVKYQCLKVLRERELLFWSCAFPLILGVMFYVAFSDAMEGEILKAIPTAVVEEEGGEIFLEYLETLDEETLQMEILSEEEALERLHADEIDGIFYAKEEPALTLAASDMEQSILKVILDTYYKNAELMARVAKEHPESMEAAVQAMSEWKETTKEVSLGGRTLNPYVSYFFALIAYACLSGAFLGMQACVDSQANLSALGARQCITPTKKMQLVHANLLVLFVIHFIEVMLLTLLIQYGFGIDLGGNMLQLVAVNLMGSMIGVSAGILLGSIGKVSYDIRMGLVVSATLVPAFLAGLMVGDMKDLLEQHCPIINRINPAAVLSDAYYCMAVFNDTSRLVRNLTILLVMSAAFLLIAVGVTRRERYDSI